MINLEFTDEAFQAIRAEAIGVWKNNATRLENGNWSTPCEEEMVERFRALQLEGESVSDTILRLIAIANRRQQ